MSSRQVPGAFEQMVLLALVRLEADAYGMTVRREIERRTSRATALGAVYATLHRLERKGLVTSRAGAPAAQRAGRGRRFYRLEPSGREALCRSLAAIDRMRRGLKGRGEIPGPVHDTQAG